MVKEMSQDTDSRTSATVDRAQSSRRPRKNVPNDWAIGKDRQSHHHPRKTLSVKLDALYYSPDKKAAGWTMVERTKPNTFVEMTGEFARNAATSDVRTDSGLSSMKLRFFIHCTQPDHRRSVTTKGGAAKFPDDKYDMAVHFFPEIKSFKIFMLPRPRSKAPYLRYFIKLAADTPADATQSGTMWKVLLKHFACMPREWLTYINLQPTKGRNPKEPRYNLRSLKNSNPVLSGTESQFLVVQNASTNKERDYSNQTQVTARPALNVSMPGQKEGFLTYASHLAEASFAQKVADLMYGVELMNPFEDEERSERRKLRASEAECVAEDDEVAGRHGEVDDDAHDNGERGGAGRIELAGGAEEIEETDGAEEFGDEQWLPI